MKNEKNIYHFLNDVNVDARDYEAVEVSIFEKEKILRNVTAKIKPTKKKRHPRLILAMLALLFALGTLQPIQAAIQTFLSNFRYSLSQALGGQDTNEGVISVQRTDYIGNVEVKLGDAIYVDDHLILNLLVDLDGSASDSQFLGFGDITASVAGKKISTHSLGNGNTLDKEKNIYSSIIDLTLSEPLAGKQDFAIDLEVQDIVYNDYQLDNELPLEGSATFTITASAAELTRHVEEYPLDVAIETPDGTIKVEKLITHPIIALLELTFDDAIEQYPLIQISGYTDTDKQVLFQPYRTDQSGKNWVITQQFSESDSNLSAEEFHHAEELILQLHYAGHPEGTEATFVPYGKPFKINMKGTGN